MLLLTSLSTIQQSGGYSYPLQTLRWPSSENRNASSANLSMLSLSAFSHGWLHVISVVTVDSVTVNAITVVTILPMAGNVVTVVSKRSALFTKISYIWLPQTLRITQRIWRTRVRLYNILMNYEFKQMFKITHCLMIIKVIIHKENLVNKILKLATTTTKA